MNKFIVLVIMLIGLNRIASGQQTIMGKVVDNETKKPINDAEVKIDGTDTSTKTNILGFFQLNVDTSQTLIISSVVYETGKIKVPADMNPFQIGLNKLKRISSDQDIILTVVEETAEFPGGIQKLYNYLVKNLKYPKDARRNNIIGKVYVEFVVDRTGSIAPEDVKVVQGLYPSCDEEAVRLVREFPQWKPGKQNGTPVKTKFIIPINFN